MRRRTALSVVPAAVGGLVPFSFASAPAAARNRTLPSPPTARWDSDERTGAVTHEAVSSAAGSVGYVRS
ncbi:hypothetical protein [Streptomyces bobili]|uniref:hypothetical protein n=1 Tax=Streptomyces bobili TaxID=67280 RepID=UPI00371030A7